MMMSMNTYLRIKIKKEKYKIIERQTMNMLRIIGDDLKKRVEENKAQFSPKTPSTPRLNMELKMKKLFKLKD